MSDFTVTITCDHINELVGAARREAAKVVQATAFGVEAEAKRIVPVDTGRLRNSITTRVDPGGLSATIAPHTDYEAFVEFGTRRMRAQPYMRPAAEKMRGPFKEAMGKILHEALGKGCR